MIHNFIDKNMQKHTFLSIEIFIGIFRMNVIDSDDACKWELLHIDSWFQRKKSIHH